MLTFLEPSDTSLGKQVYVRLVKFQDVNMSGTDLTTCLDTAKSFALVLLTQEGILKYLPPTLRWLEDAEGMFHIYAGQSVLQAGPDVRTITSLSKPSKLFTNLVLSVSGLSNETKEILQFLIKRHGGVYKRKLKRNVTHLLVKEPGSLKYKAACESGMTILCPGWVFDAFLRGTLPNQNKPEYAVPIFPRNAKISTTEFTPEGRRQLKLLIRAYGGAYESGICRETKFLVARGWSRKTDFALKNNIPVLSREWILDMVRFRGCIDIRDYELHFEDRKLVYPAIVTKGLEHNFMQGVVVSTLGLSVVEKRRAHQILTAAGAMSYGEDGIQDDATHILCNVRERHMEKVKRSGNRPIVTLSWVERCYRSKTIINVKAHEDAVKLPIESKEVQVAGNEAIEQSPLKLQKQSPTDVENSQGVPQQDMSVLQHVRENVDEGVRPSSLHSERRDDVQDNGKSQPSQAGKRVAKASCNRNPIDLTNLERRGSQLTNPPMMFNKKQRVSSGPCGSIEESIIIDNKENRNAWNQQIQPSRSLRKRVSQESGNLDLPRKRHKQSAYRIMFSGWERWEAERKRRLIQEIEKFDNVTLEADATKVTHLVSGALMKTPKTIVAFMNGAKIMLPGWVDACLEAGAVVDEAPYLWTTRGVETLNKMQRELVRAITNADLGLRPWEGKKVCLLMAKDHPHGEAFKQILVAAGAKLQQTISRNKPDMCLACEVTQQTRSKPYQACINAGVSCYDARYLLDSIFAPEVDAASFLVAGCCEN